MTANMIKGKGFKGALRYNLEKVDKGIAEVLDHSFVAVSEKSILKEIQLIKVLRPNLQKFFYHTSINFPPSEDLTNATMTQIGKDYLQESGFTQNQYIMFRHHDADHPHLHILVNRINYDGKVLSDSNDFARCEKILRDLEKKYNLTEVISSKQASERAITKDELEMMKRTNTPSHKMTLQVLIKDTINSNKKLTCSEFIQALEKKGIHILFNQASTGFVSGISYSYEGMIITGAKLGNDYKWASIKNSINYEQERDRAAIHQANDRTKSNSSIIRTGTPHPERNSVTLSQGSGKQSATSHQRENPKLDDRKQSQTGSGGKHLTKPANAKASRVNNLSSENSKGLNLATLLDGHSHGNLIEPVNQHDLDLQNALGPKKRKKKRRRTQI
jgi:hypothetical protein